MKQPNDQIRRKPAVDCRTDNAADQLRRTRLLAYKEMLARAQEEEDNVVQFPGRP